VILVNIVCFSAIDWDFLFQRAQHIAKGLSENGCSIIYVNPPNNLPRDVSVKKPATQYITDFAQYIRVGIFQRKALVNRHLITFNPVNYFGPNRTLQQIFLSLEMLMLRSLNLLYFRSNRIDIWLFFEPTYSSYVLPYVAKGKIVYDCADESSGFSNVSPHIVETEQNLIRKSALVIVTSTRLLQKVRKINRNCLYVPNAADFQHFHSATKIMNEPREIEDLKKPVIGFIGAIYDWIDTELICELAKIHPDFSVLLVGPVNFDKNRLEKYSNITMVGTREYGILPQYLSSMDVCLIPFKINKLTLASNPIKLYEYLAAGKPIVSTDLPEVAKNASDVILIGKNHRDFIQKVEAALNTTSEEEEAARLRRIEFAKANSWNERVGSIKRYLENSR